MRSGKNVYLSAPELYGSFAQGKERVVFTHADVEAGLEFRSALADDDGPSLSELAAEKLYAAILRITVSSVP